jgi:ketosteroid isomerase-like protein
MNTKTDVETLLRRCYDAFNRRDLEGALALMHPDVTWPNGWEGGWLHGRDEVREYWQRSGRPWIRTSSRVRSTGTLKGASLCLCIRSCVT